MLELIEHQLTEIRLNTLADGKWIGTKLNLHNSSYKRYCEDLINLKEKIMQEKELVGNEIDSGVTDEVANETFEIKNKEDTGISAETQAQIDEYNQAMHNENMRKHTKIGDLSNWRQNMKNNTRRSQILSGYTKIMGLVQKACTS